MRVKCERLDYFGRGVCHLDGKAVFVYDLLEGEEADIKIVLTKKKYMIGEVLEYIVKSHKRVCAECMYKKCGCHVNNMSYESTLDFKKNKVKDILNRFCNIQIDMDIIPSPKIYGYRNKITLKVVNGMVGYFKNGSNDLIEIDKCLIVTDRINEVIKILKNEDLSKVREIVIKDFDDVMVIIDGIMNIDNLRSICKSIYMDGRYYGKDKVICSLGDYKFNISKDSFFQVNKDVCLKMYEKTLEYAGTGDRAIDLFCGTGTISMFLSSNFKHVIGSEIIEEAIRCARENAKLNNVYNVKFLCGDSNKLIKGEVCDSLVVDPARGGLSKDGIKNILDIKPKKLVYISCNVMSLARDLNSLCELYDVKEITLFDMFPWTHHVESVCLLERC